MDGERTPMRRASAANGTMENAIGISESGKPASGTGWTGLAASLRLLMIGLLLGLMTGCGTLPPLDGRTVSTALPAAEAQATPLGKAISPQSARHPGKSGIYLLSDAREAFVARVQMVEAAERTLDVQYYIWRPDVAGNQLFAALLHAADRGVRVRLLLDDNNTAGLDEMLAALDAHPLIEVRLFNPLAIRNPRALGYVGNLSRMNRRMHNKSLTADNAVTIVGGRNIGDEYFGESDGPLFEDLDVLAIGPVVGDVSADFDLYWSSASSYPADRLLPPASPEAVREKADSWAELERSPQASHYAEAARASPLRRDLLRGTLDLDWAGTRMVSDDPAKGLGQAPPDMLSPEQLKRIIGMPTAEMDLVSSYFVPTDSGVGAFQALSGKGVTIRILTNSLEATDVPAVHAGYSKRRKPLLEAGVKLYEMKRTAPPRERRFGRGSGRKRTGGLLGSSSSSSSLHAKTFSVDGSSVYVGSFNFDPRSSRLNTELGFVIGSPRLARKIEQAFDTTVPAASYEVKLSDTGDIYWVEQKDGQTVRHDTEPGTTFWQRLKVRMLSLLPIDWLL